MELLIFAILVSIFGFWSIVADIAKAIAILVLIIVIIASLANPHFHVFYGILLGIGAVSLVGAVLYGIFIAKPSAKDVSEPHVTYLSYQDIAPYLSPAERQRTTQFLANAKPDDSLEITLVLSSEKIEKLTH